MWLLREIYRARTEALDILWHSSASYDEAARLLEEARQTNIGLQAQLFELQAAYLRAVKRIEELSIKLDIGKGQGSENGC